MQAQEPRWDPAWGALPGVHQQQLPSISQRHQTSLPRVQANGHPSQAPPSPLGGRLAETSEYMALAQLVERSDGGAVRQVIRDHMEKCMLGSDYHMEFVISYALQHANPAIFGKSLLDFGEDPVRSCKLQIVNLWKQQDITDVAGPLLSKASTDVLDQALAMRLDSIQARALVAALARARRLGYDDQDIVEEKRDGTEVVISAAEVNVPAAVARRQPHLKGTLPGPAPPCRSMGVVPNSSTPRTLQAQVPLPAQASSPHVPSPPVPQQAFKETSAHAASQNTQQGPVPNAHRQILYCDRCYRPCSGAHALRYHQLKKLCQSVPEDFRQLGVEFCPHCGMRFSSQGGLLYHKRAGVCGHYSQENEKYIYPELDSYYNRKRQATPAAGPAKTRFNAANKAYQGPLQCTPGSAASPKSGEDPMSSLSPEERQRMQDQLNACTDQFAPLMQAAMNLPEVEREVELAKLKNRYNTKQSMTRKKFGIRLRERRSKEDIDLERKRLFGEHADLELSTLSGGGPLAKRIRLGREGKASPMETQATTPTSASMASPAPFQTRTPAASPAPSPASEPSQAAAGAAKQPRATTPTKQAPEVASSGLSEAPATAEYTDPTAVTASSTAQSSSGVRTSNTGAADAVVIQDDSPESTDDDEDIPAKIPSQIAP